MPAKHEYIYRPAARVEGDISDITGAAPVTSRHASFFYAPSWPGMAAITDAAAFRRLGMRAR